MPLTYIGGPVTDLAEHRPEGRDLLVELGVLRLDDVVDHTMSGQITASEEARPARRARRRVGVVAVEFETFCDQPVPPRKVDAFRQPASLALLVRDDEKDVGCHEDRR